MSALSRLFAAGANAPLGGGSDPGGSDPGGSGAQPRVAVWRELQRETERAETWQARAQQLSCLGSRARPPGSSGFCFSALVKNYLSRVLPGLPARNTGTHQGEEHGQRNLTVSLLRESERADAWRKLAGALSGKR